MGLSSDGARVYVTGASFGINTDLDYATVAYDAATGNTLWIRRYNGPGNEGDLAHSLGLSPDGARVYVTGQSEGIGSFKDYATVAYDAVTGDTLWVRRQNGQANELDGAFSLGVSPDGARVFVTGVSEEMGHVPEFLTVAYEAATGDKVWARRYDGPSNGGDVGDSLAISPDGTRVFVTGESFGIGTDFDYATVAYDAATGNTHWVSRYNGPGNRLDFPDSIAASPDGTRVYVTGFAEGDFGADYATVTYDVATGERLTVRTYDGPGSGFDGANSLAVSPDGARVYVTGESWGIGTEFDYATVAYDSATGNRVWIRRYDGPRHQGDFPSSVAVSPDGTRVYVTGRSDGIGTLSDYATVAYRAP